jgi:hypothetical protein
MSSMHFSLRPATQADGRKITIRQALVNFTDWQTAMLEEKILRATTIADDSYQRRPFWESGSWRQHQQHLCSGGGLQGNY